MVSELFFGKRAFMADIESKGAGGAEGESQAKAEWQQALAYVKENPRQVAGGAVFLLVCIVAGGFYSLWGMITDREKTTEYAAALAEEDPGIRASELRNVALEDTRWRAEALYLSGEASIEAKAYEEARTAFKQVVSEYGKTEYAAPAAEGLAFLDENNGNLKDALAGYKGVFETYSDTFIARRQPYNIARVQEALDQLPEAIENYKLQSERFPESSVAALSDQALARLKSDHPDLFPEDENEHDESEHAEGGDASVTESEAAETTPAPEASLGAPAPAETESAPAAETPAAADNADSAAATTADPAPDETPDSNVAEAAADKTAPESSPAESAETAAPTSSGQ